MHEVAQGAGARGRAGSRRTSSRRVDSLLRRTFIGLESSRHPRGDIGSGGKVEPLPDVLDVAPDGRRRETKTSRDHHVLQPLGHEPGDLELALAQAPDPGIGQGQGAELTGLVAGATHVGSKGRMNRSELVIQV